MKRRWLPLVLFVALGVGGGCDTVPPDATIRLEGYNYFVFLPQNYEEVAEAPMILFLHGATQEASSEDEATRYLAVPRYALEHDDFPFVVIAPQSPPPDTWIDERLVDVIDEALTRFRIDEDRIYVTGLSMGGFGTFLLGAHIPDRIAAAAPMAGGGIPGEACNMKDVPTWVFHNRGDDIVSVNFSIAMVEALEACQGDVRFTLYERGGHDSWSDTYFDPVLYEWFLSHRLSDRR